MMSLCWSFAKTSTTLPSVVLSRDRHPSKMRVIHNWLALWPPPCSNRRAESKSSSRRVRVRISAREFSYRNHLSPGSSSPCPFSLASTSSAPKLPTPLSPLSQQGRWPQWLPSLGKGFFPAIPPAVTSSAKALMCQHKTWNRPQMLGLAPLPPLKLLLPQHEANLIAPASTITPPCWPI